MGKRNATLGLRSFEGGLPISRVARQCVGVGNGLGAVRLPGLGHSGRFEARELRPMV